MPKLLLLVVALHPVLSGCSALYVSRLENKVTDMKINKFHVLVMNKWSFEQLVPLDEPYAVISIRSPGRDKAKPAQSPYLKDILYLEFWDNDNPQESIQREQSDKIAAFVKNTKAKWIVCQCEVGICRSAAIAAAIVKSRGQDNSYFFERYSPNLYVYRHVLSSFGRTQ